LLVVNRTPSDDLRERVEDAVDGCPRAALRIDED
jgi:ferredoxin